MPARKKKRRTSEEAAKKIVQAIKKAGYSAEAEGSRRVEDYWTVRATDGRGVARLTIQGGDCTDLRPERTFREMYGLWPKARSICRRFGWKPDY
jgi:hypothetical protein